MMYFAMLDFASDSISNFFRYTMWQIIKPLINLLNVLLNALVNGILPFSILSNEWVNQGYQACIILMISILPAKIAWELFYAVMMDADNIDPSKKIFGAMMCFIIAVSMQIVIPMVNNISINASKELMKMEYVGSSGSNKKTIDNTQTDFSKNLVVSVLCSFGGMEKNNTIFSYVTNGKGKKMDIGADRFYDYVINPTNALSGYDGEPSNKSGRSSSSFFSRGKYDRWSFYYRWDTSGSYHFGGTEGSDDFDLLGKWDQDSSFPEAKEQGGSEAYGTHSIPSNKSQAKKAYDYMLEHSGDYIWDFSYIGVLVGLVVFVIMLGYISIEIAMRIIMIGFWYIISPLCCLSLTNQQNPQAFNVWKNAIIGAFLVNFSQIFLLQFFLNISSSILNNKATGVANTITSLILYFASLSVVISAPPFIQSMIGGYGSGFLESMNQMKGVWNSIGGGAVMAAGKKIMGRHNDLTGHLTGGIRGKIFGNKNMSGEKVGGIKNRIKTMSGGITDAILGKKDKNPYTKDKDGNNKANPHYGDRSGGLMGTIMGNKSNSQGGRTGRVPIKNKVSQKANNLKQRGARNFRYAPTAQNQKKSNSNTSGGNKNGVQKSTRSTHSASSSGSVRKQNRSSSTRVQKPSSVGRPSRQSNSSSSRSDIRQNTNSANTRRAPITSMSDLFNNAYSDKNKKGGNDK